VAPGIVEDLLDRGLPELVSVILELLLVLDPLPSLPQQTSSFWFSWSCRDSRLPVVRQLAVRLPLVQLLPFLLALSLNRDELLLLRLGQHLSFHAEHVIRIYLIPDRDWSEHAHVLGANSGTGTFAG